MNIEKTANYWSRTVCRLHDNTIVSFMGVGIAHVSPSYSHVYD